MINAIINTLMHPGILLLLLLLLLLIITGVVFALRSTWKISAWKTNTDNRLNNLGQRVSNLEQRFSNLERSSEQRFSNLEQQYSKIVGFLAGRENDIGSLQGRGSLALGNSPVMLTDRGKRIAEMIDAYSVADRYLEDLVKRAKEENMTPYQIQESCFFISFMRVENDLEENDKERLRKIGNVAYAENLHMFDLMRVLGLVLRDKVFEAIKE